MNWHELALNPEAITHLYRAPPSLRGVHLTEVRLHRDGPRMSIYALLSQFPDDPPQRWVREGRNVAAIQLDFFPVSEIEIAGWTTENLADIEITAVAPERLLISARWASGRVSAVCGAFRIAHLTAHIAGE